MDNEQVNGIVQFATGMAVLGLVSSMIGGIASMMAGSSHSSSKVRRLGRPRTEEERAIVHEKFYGTKELPARGQGLEERGEFGHHSSPGVVVMPKLPEEARKDILFVEYIRDLVKLGETVTDEEAKYMWEAWKKRAEHHSMWLTPEQRETLEKKYGAVSVRWGEEIAPVGDLVMAEKAAKVFYEKMREAVGIA